MSSDRLAVSPRAFNRVQIIRSILDGYKGDIPFHRYLKAFFAKNRSFGSTDRRTYRNWCFAWFRIGGSLPHLGFHERICWAYYLVYGQSDSLFTELTNASCKHVFPEGPLAIRIAHVKTALGVEFPDSIFPGNVAFSQGVSHYEWCESHLEQPDVFIRVREKCRKYVLDELHSKNINFKPTVLANAFAFAENTDLLSLDTFKKGYFEIQDLASQMVCENIPVNSGSMWWDCCSGGGGKALLLMDRFPDMRLVCSDVRDLILENLKQRSARARMNPLSILTLDASKQVPENILFDGILLDAPCSGSGTWRRNPENLILFEESSISFYHTRQLEILKNVSRSLKPGGFLVYITCSVFQLENENVIHAFTQSNDFQIIDMKLVNGVLNNSDSLFVSVLQQTNRSNH